MHPRLEIKLDYTILDNASAEQTTDARQLSEHNQTIKKYDNRKERKKPQQNPDAIRKRNTRRTQPGVSALHEIIIITCRNNCRNPPITNWCTHVLAHRLQTMQNVIIITDD